MRHLLVYQLADTSPMRTIYICIPYTNNILLCIYIYKYNIKKLTNEILLSVLPLHNHMHLYPVCQPCDKIAKMASTVLMDRLHGLIIIFKNGCHMFIGCFHIRVSKQKD